MTKTTYKTRSLNVLHSNDVLIEVADSEALAFLLSEEMRPYRNAVELVVGYDVHEEHVPGSWDEYSGGSPPVDSVRYEIESVSVVDEDGRRIGSIDITPEAEEFILGIIED